MICNNIVVVLDSLTKINIAIGRSFHNKRTATIHNTVDWITWN